MSERPPQYGLEPQACPFIALVDDRDRRLDVPDDRHRCYAEPSPQPRAEAHQRAYCLTAAFAACPIFLDWATRAAADPVTTRRTTPTPSQLARPTDHEPPPRPVDPAARSWAAPPPWSGDAAQPRPRPASEQLAAFDEPVEAPDRDLDLRAVPVDSAALAGARVMPDVARDVPPDALPGGPPDAPSDLPPDALPNGPPDVPPFLAGRQGSVDRDAALPTPLVAGMPGVSVAPIPPIQPIPPIAPQASQRVQIGGALPPGQARLAPAKRLDSKPGWAGSRRQEAYPMLRTRLGLFGPAAIIAVVAGVLIVVLAVSLLLGFQGGGLSPVPTQDPNASPTPTAPPTPSPTPSPVTYTVVSGDSLFNIAKDHGLTVDQIACANNITDPNVLQVGQVLIIPDDEYVCPGSESPSASPPG